MGLFADELKRLMDEKGLKQVDSRKIAAIVVTQSTIAAIFRGFVPRNMEVINQIAKVLDVDARTMRILVFSDVVSGEMARYGLQVEDICKEYKVSSIKRHRIPLYNQSELLSAISEKGYPVSEGEYIDLAIDCGSYAYAVKIETDVFRPRILPGEIAVMRGNVHFNGGDNFGIVKTLSKLYMGKIMLLENYVVVESLSPYEISHIRKKDVEFMHKVVMIIDVKSLPA